MVKVKFIAESEMQPCLLLDTIIYEIHRQEKTTMSKKNEESKYEVEL